MGDYALLITKMHGLGNDFVVVEESEVKGLDITELTRQICHRRLGAGADGLIIVCPSDTCDIRMRIINADGSEAEMCGNGIRCFAKYVYEKGIVGTEDFTVETLAGTIRPRLCVKDGKVESVTVDMGVPYFKNAEIPVIDGVDPQNLHIEAGGKEFDLVTVLVGVPHTVFFTKSADDDLVSGFGPLIEKHDVFPRNTNVNFAEVIDEGTIRLKTWERGCGRTLACGTGSCATAVAANLKGYCGEKVEIINSVGSLFIELKDGRVYMSGPAETVYTGQYIYGGNK